MWVGIGLLVLSWIFQPGFVRTHSSNPAYANDWTSDYFVAGVAFFLTRDFRPQYQWLAVIDAVIVSITAGAIATLSKK